MCFCVHSHHYACIINPRDRVKETAKKFSNFLLQILFQINLIEWKSFCSFFIFFWLSWEKSEIDLINFYVVNMILSKANSQSTKFLPSENEKFLPQSHFISFLPMKHNKMFVIQRKLGDGMNKLRRIFRFFPPKVN